MTKRLGLTLLLGLGACSSLQGFKGWLVGGDDEVIDPAKNARDPASVSEDGEIIDPAKAMGQVQSDPNNPTSTEFDPKAKQWDDQAQRGFRRKASPWDGVSSVNEGSLWKEDSQNGFYFSRNLLHQVGDFVLVKLEPEITESMNQKLISIYKPGAKPSVQKVIADEAGKAAGDKVADAVGKAVGNKNIGDAVGGAVADRTVASLEDKPKRLFQINEVAARITEILPKGTLRLEGTKKIFLKSGTFDFKFGGIVRDEDITPANSIASARVFESKAEILK